MLLLSCHPHAWGSFLPLGFSPAPHVLGRPKGEPQIYGASGGVPCLARRVWPLPASPVSPSWAALRPHLGAVKTRRVQAAPQTYHSGISGVTPVHSRGREPLLCLRPSGVDCANHTKVRFPAASYPYFPGPGQLLRPQRVLHPGQQTPDPHLSAGSQPCVSDYGCHVEPAWKVGSPQLFLQGSN